MVHDQGFSGDGKIYKLVTFSLLYPSRYRTVAGGLEVESPVVWWVSSPVGELIEALAAGFLKDPAQLLGPYPIQVERVEVEPPPRWEEVRILKTLSPICVSTGRREGDRFRKVFVPPDDPLFCTILYENLKRKARALGESDLAEDGTLSLEWLRPPTSKLFTVHGVEVRGWMGTFRITAPEPLLRVGYESGLGERTAQGFGMVGVP
jgi:CRISPR-associated endoribonuclease Cas6